MSKFLPKHLNDDKLFVASYSVSQKAGHVDMLWHYLEFNNDHLLKGAVTDYKTLFIGTQEECHQFLENLEETLIQ